jgi:hypothetical protein
MAFLGRLWVSSFIRFCTHFEGNKESEATVEGAGRTTVTVDIRAILDDLDWEDVLQAEDADYQLRFLDESYEPWLEQLEDACCAEGANFDRRRWCYEAILAIAPTGPHRSQAEACLRSSMDGFLRRVPTLFGRNVDRRIPVKYAMLIVIGFTLVLLACSIWWGY